jgi:hypothetical protein
VLTPRRPTGHLPAETAPRSTITQFFEYYFRRAEPVIFAAIARGELPAATDTDGLVRTLIAPIHLRLLTTAEPISATTADNAAAVALAAAFSSAPA